MKETLDTRQKLKTKVEPAIKFSPPEDFVLNPPLTITLHMQTMAAAWSVGDGHNNLKHAPP
jgi:hypothetical protein